MNVVTETASRLVPNAINPHNVRLQSMRNDRSSSSAATGARGKCSPWWLSHLDVGDDEGERNLILELGVAIQALSAFQHS